MRKFDLNARMRRLSLTAFMLTAACALSLNAAAGQLSGKIAMGKTRVSVEEVFDAITRQSGYDIFYNYDELDVRRTVTLPAADMEVGALLRAVLGTRYGYQTSDNTIVISQAQQSQTPAQSGAARITQQQPVSILSGRVIDKKGKPLAGVVVETGNGRNGTSTDNAGAYRLRVPAGTKIIRFSFVGLRTVEVSYTGQEVLHMDMEEETHSAGEVVVTGIFNKSRDSYTGAATSITARELRMAGNRSLITSISNIDPSFNIVDNIDIGSDPNQLPTITVRGTSSMPVGMKDMQTQMKNTAEQNMPLIILNGFEVPLQRLYDLDQSLVESITLLKDASATAMYGTRGSNGVVVINTRTPEKGRLIVTYRGDVNVEAPDLTSYNLMNAREKLDFEVAAGLYESDNPIRTEEVRELYFKRKMAVERGVDTYWLKYPVRTGIGQRHSLGIEGGENTFRYAVNLAFNNISGAMKNSHRNTFSGNMLFMYQVRNLKFQNDFQVSLNKSMNSNYGNFYDYGKLNSYWIPYNEDGTVKKVLENFNYSNLGERTGVLQKVMNPLYNAHIPSRNSMGYIGMLNNFLIEWLITPELFVRGQFGISTQRDRQDNYISNKNTYFDNYPTEDFERKGVYSLGNGISNSYQGQLTLNYMKKFDDKNQLFVGLGGNISERDYEQYSMTAEGISIAEIDYIGMARKYQDGKPGASESLIRSVGLLANLNYTYDNRYFIDLSGKADGSSQFGSDNRVAPFWSAGAGWNIHNEKFFANNKQSVNLLRVRLSYGFTGSQNFPSYLAYTTYSDGGGASYQGGYAVSLMAMGNEKLKWQRTGQYNAGADVEFFDSRFRLKVDVYRKLTKGFLSQVTLPLATGFYNYTANIGEVENKGVELSANVFILRDADGVSWSIGAAAAHNKNTIKKISESLKMLNEYLKLQSNISPSFLYEEGRSQNTIYAVKSLGIDPSNGLEIFQKKNGAETYYWEPGDKVPCGVTDPKVTGTVNTMFRWKGFDITAYFQYRVGGQAYNHVLAEKVENIYPFDNADRRAFYDRWKTPGEQARFKSLKDHTRTPATSRLVMDNNSFAFSTVSVGYEVPQAWAQKNLAMSYLAVKFYTEDILYLSSIKRERGLNYPFSRKYSLSLTARF